MRTLTGPDGTASLIFEPGDLVRVIRSEIGLPGGAQAGEWGRVLRVHPCGAVDLRLAGFSRPKDSELPRAMAVPRGRLEPCDARGQPMHRGFSGTWDSRLGR
jgi:hypothetical protein